MKSDKSSPPEAGRSWAVAVVALFALRAALNLAAITRYGFHRDELLYIDMGKQLAWGYHGKPPAIALLAKLGGLFGGSLVGYRVLPVVAGLVTVWLGGELARQMGGGKWARAATMLALVLWPVSLRNSAVLWPAAFMLVWWGFAFLVLVRLLRHRSSPGWLAWGLAWGLAVLTSYGGLVVGIVTLIGVALTVQRRHFRTAWPWLGVGLTVAVASLHIAWLAGHKWAVASLSGALFVTQAGWSHLAQEASRNLPAMALILPLGVFGLFHLWGASFAPALRPLAWALLGALAALVLGVRSQAVAPVFLPAVAAGGVMLERVGSWPGTWLRRGMLAFVIGVGLAGVPLSLPVLPAQATYRYGSFLHHDLSISAPLIWEDGQVHELPQDFADMLGWESLVATVNLLYCGLPPDMRAECVILTADRGQAGAVNLLGAQYGLPKAKSIDADYYRWGPGPEPGTILIAVGMPPGVLALHYDMVEAAASVVTRFARQPAVHLLVCAQPHVTLQEIWPLLALAKKE